MLLLILVRQSAILKDNSIPQKTNTMDVTSNNSNYKPTNTYNLPIENIAVQGASLNTDIITASSAPETSDNSITASSGHVSVPVTDASAELSCLDKTDCTGDTEHITISQAVQNIDKHTAIEEIQITHVSNVQMQQTDVEELKKDKLDENKSDVSYLYIHLFSCKMNNSSLRCLMYNISIPYGQWLIANHS